MQLTFDPALRTCTTLPILPGGGGTYRFTASFSNHAEYERARQEGTRVEMWTNLPIGGGASQWRALRFAYAEETVIEGAPEDKVMSLVPPTVVSARETQPTTVTLDFSLTNIRPASLYSFTYRLVRPWGVQWLGAYRQNGDLIFEEKDVRFSLTNGCKLEDNTIVTRSAVSESVVVATLNDAISWACWGFGRNG